MQSMHNHGVGSPGLPLVSRRETKLRRTESGFIIVAVLWILGAIATLATIYSLYISQTTAAFSVYNERLQGEALVQAGVELAVFQLINAGEIPPVSGGVGRRFGPVNVSVLFQSENARIDLNAAPKELLAGLFTSQGASADAAAEYAERIVGWRTPPSPGSTTDDEASAYRVAGKTYGPRRGPFPHVNELSLVLGLPPLLVERALPYLTVYSGQPEINLIIALPEVLAALPGMTPGRLHDLLEQRNKTPEQLLRGQLGALGRYLTAQGSNATRMTVDVIFDSQRRNRSEVVVMVMKGDSEPYRVLSWRDEIDAQAAQPAKASIR